MSGGPTVANLTQQLARSTERLADELSNLDHDAVAAPSALPGWTRAHVLTHLARNGDGLRNLLLAARSGITLRMYANPEARTADIDAGATRARDVIVDDVLESDRRFAAEVGAMPSECWGVEVEFTSGQPNAPRVAAHEVLVMRLNEVVVHHVDLGLRLRFGDVDDDIADCLVRRYAQRYTDRGVPVDSVAGRVQDRLAWLAGRSQGADLQGADDGPLPVLPSLG